jgi:hypothetical protein
MPLKSGHIVLVESKIEMDTSLVQDRWNERLNAMQATLQKQGIQTHKRPIMSWMRFMKESGLSCGQERT